MNLKVKVIFLIILMTILLSSCSIMYQRAYIATSPNVNCFERENEKNLKVSLFLNHYDLQSNFVLNKHFGLSACINGGFRGQIGGELAGIYYNRFKNNNYFETQYGYGYFVNQTKLDGVMIVPGSERGTYLWRDIDTRYHKIFIQPTFVMFKKNKSIGFALKLSANYYDKYYYYNSTSKGGDSGECYDKTFTGDFRHKWNFAIEPVLKVQFNRKFFIQFSGVLSNKINTSTIYNTVTAHEGGLLFESTGKIGNPQHLSFLITLGYEIKFGKKNQ